MGTLCIFSGHDDRVISLGAIKLFLLALESAWATVAASAGGWAGFALRVGRKRAGDKGEGRMQQWGPQLIATHVGRACPGDVNKNKARGRGGSGKPPEGRLTLPPQICIKEGAGGGRPKGDRLGPPDNFESHLELEAPLPGLRAKRAIPGLSTY